MKWFIAVVFYTLQGDVYVFTEPTFDTQQQCMASVTDPQQAQSYARKLVLEYGRLMPIQAIACIDEDTYLQLQTESLGERI